MAVAPTTLVLGRTALPVHTKSFRLAARAVPILAIVERYATPAPELVVRLVPVAAEGIVPVVVADLAARLTPQSPARHRRVAIGMVMLCCHQLDVTIVARHAVALGHTI